MKKEFKISLKYIVLFLIPFLMLSVTIYGQSDTIENFSEVFEKNDANLTHLSNWNGFLGQPYSFDYKDNYAFIGGTQNFALAVIYVPLFAVPTIVAEDYHAEGNYTVSTDIDISTNDNYIFMTTMNLGLIIYHFDNLTNALTRIGSYQTPTYFETVSVNNETCFLTTNDNRLITLNITNPSTPTFLDEYNTGFGISNSYIDNNLAYLACGSNGIQILNVSNPSSINFYNSLAISGVYDLFVINEIIFATTTNLVIYNQTDSTSNSYTTLAFPNGVTIQDDIAYLPEGPNAELVDISDLTNPQYVSSFTAPFPGSISEICVDRNFLFYIDFAGLFGIYDCFDPYNIIQGVLVPIHGYSTDIYVEGTSAYIAAANFSLVALDITSPTNPVPNAYYGSYTAGHHIVAANDYLFLAGIGDVVEILDPQLPIEYVSNYTTMEGVTEMSVHGNRLYIANYGGLDIVDISDPSNPVKYDETTSPNNNLDGVFANNNDTIYGYSHSSLHTFDVSTQGAISVLDTYSLSYGIEDFYCEGTQIVTVGQQQLNVFDVTNPSAIAEIGSKTFSGDIPKVVVKNNVCFLQERGVGIHIINLTDLPDLTIIDTISDTHNKIESICVTEDYICFAKFDAGIDFYSYEIEQAPIVEPTPTPTPTPTTSNSPPGSPSNLMLWLSVGLSAGVIVVVLPLSIVIARKRMIAKREVLRRDAAISKLTTCYHCGYLIRKDAITCDDCGNEIIRCVVCKLPVSLGDTLGQCSLCEAKAHYEHMIDWVGKRGKCPYCQQKMPEDSVIVISSDAEPKKKINNDLED